MRSTKIAAIKTEYQELTQYCQENGQFSFAMYIDDSYKKILLLSAASYFEAVIVQCVHDFAVKTSKNNKEIVSFIDNKALTRQYHTFFEWEGKNTNKFFSMFGQDFKIKARQIIDERKLSEAEVAFLTVGKERNYLVHRNFAEATINSTFDEIFRKYERACDFADLVKELLES